MQTYLKIMFVLAVLGTLDAIFILYFNYNEKSKLYKIAERLLFILIGCFAVLGLFWIPLMIFISAKRAGW